MVSVPSTMLPLGTTLPDFTLPNATDGRLVRSAGSQGPGGMLVMFICNHCPYVKHVKSEIGRLSRDYGKRGVSFIAICSNDAAAYPDDAPGQMKAVAREERWEFPYLFDETQEVAKTFRAACTPEFYLFDSGPKLVYRGQLDGSRPRNDIPVTGRDVRAALDALLEGKQVPADQTPSIGCNIKWKKGNEPDYFTQRSPS